MILNMIDKKIYLYRILVFVVTILTITACTDTMGMPDDVSDIENITISFQANTPKSRAGYEELTSWFEKGDLIGCVIARKTGKGEDATYEYVAKSKWEYRKDGFLILKGLKNKNENAEDIRTSKIICIDSKNNDDSYLKLQQDYDYAFFFYYPYVDDEIVRTDFLTHGRENVVNPYCSVFIPGDPNWDSYHEFNNIQKTMLVGEVAENAEYAVAHKNKLTRYSWTNYPVCISPRQNTKEKVNASDFMWVRYIIDQATMNTVKDNITQKNANYKVDLEFKKKLAAIEVQSDMVISDVVFKRTQTYMSPIVQCKHIDLTTGKLENYAGYEQNGVGSYLPNTSGSVETWGPNAINNWSYYLGLPTLKGELLQRYCTYISEEYKPFNYSGNGKDYRMVFVPQEFISNQKDLGFSFKMPSGETKTIDLSTKLSLIEENKLYIIHIDRKSNIEIIINDWVTGTITDIEEINK